MEAVFLTGATGFIGRHILRELETRRKQSIIAVRPGWENRIQIDTELTRVVETKDVFAEGYDWWREHLRGAAMGIHAAWVAKPGSYLTTEENLDCLAGTLFMAKAAAAVKLQRFVGLGTCIEYKSSDEPLSVESPLDPKTPYAAAKVGAFLTLREVFAQSGVSFLWCRLFHPYGPGEHPNRLYPFLHQQLSTGSVAELTQGTQIRDFIEVTKAAQLIIDGALSNFEGPANICSGKGKSVREHAEEIADIYGRRDLLNFGSRPVNASDTPRIVGIPTVFDGG